MRAYSLSHLSDPELIRSTATSSTQEDTGTAVFIAHIAEMDARRLYLPLGYPSMHAYCVGALHKSEDAAFRRITAARAARQFPAIFEALADGRVHLTAVNLLAPYLTPENAADLLAAAAHRSRTRIEALIAERFPRSEALGLVVALPTSAGEQLAPARVGADSSESIGQLAPARVPCLQKETPIAAQRYLIELTIGKDTQEMLRCAQELLGHELPSGDMARVFHLALEALVEKLHKRKFAATSQPRGSRPSTNPRHIPAHVKRAVWARDGGQCTFVSETGHRCEARKSIEFDHVEPVARGGTATVAGIRLHCRAHNQYAAERAFGAGFMRGKRESARRVTEARRREAERVRAAAEEVIAPLRSLGFSAKEAQCAARLCEAIPDSPLEHRVRRALTYFRQPGTSTQAASARSAP